MHVETDAVESVLRYLDADGFSYETAGEGRYVLVSLGADSLPLRPVLDIPANLFVEYLQDMARGIDYAPDPLTEALSLSKIHIVEEMGTHGLDRNYVTALGFRRVRGRVTFYVEHDFPEPGPPPPPDPDLSWVSDRPE